jgi:bifunctional UDP-N-acetylglucosamine pyrophosphorylase/glucosamine-1-phosphate N-acetyltransferase
VKGAHIHSGFIGDSVIGQDCRIGANFITGNRRLDRSEIYAYVQGRKVNTSKTYLGAIIGHQTKMGINTSTSPNVIINNQTIVAPNSYIDSNID